MSLEQALIDATAAIKTLTTVLVTAGGIAAAAPAPAAPPKVAKPPKVDAAPAPVPAPAHNHGYTANVGDPDGTRYFIIAAHNTVYKQAPGDADCTLAGAEIVSGAAYLAYQAELAKKFHTAAAPQQPAPTAPTATAPQAVASAGVTATFEQVVAKMRQLHAKLQNPGIQQVLTKYGVTGVPALNGKASNETLIADIEAILNA